MMEIICIIACVALVIWGLVIIHDTKHTGQTRSGRGTAPNNSVRTRSCNAGADHTRSSGSPPPLPPRNNVRPNQSTVKSGNLHHANGAAANSLPHRRPPLPNTVKKAGNNCGPRGIDPSKYPCCPLCKQRNKEGKQLIFWNQKEQYYHCSKGHRFGSDGNPL